MFFLCRLCFQTYLLNLKRWISTTPPQSPTIPHSASRRCRRRTPQTVCDPCSAGDRAQTPREVQGSGDRERLLLCRVLSLCWRAALAPHSFCPAIGSAGFGKSKNWEREGFTGSSLALGRINFDSPEQLCSKVFLSRDGRMGNTRSEFSSSTCSPGLFIIFFPIFTQVGGLKIGDPNRITGFLWVVLENLKLNWSVFCFLIWDC